MGLLSTKQAAEQLGISLPRIHQLINEGRLPAEKVGRDYVIKAEDLKLVGNRKVGRPPKAEVASGQEGRVVVKKKSKKGGKK